MFTGRLDCSGGSDKVCYVADTTKAKHFIGNFLGRPSQTIYIRYDVTVGDIIAGVSNKPFNYVPGNIEAIGYGSVRASKIMW